MATYDVVVSKIETTTYNVEAGDRDDAEASALALAHEDWDANQMTFQVEATTEVEE